MVRDMMLPFVCLLVVFCFVVFWFVVFCFVLSFVCLLSGFFWPEAICNIALGGCCWDVGMALETATICWNSTNQQKTAFLNRQKDDTLNKRQETSTREHNSPTTKNATYQSEATILSPFSCRSPTATWRGPFLLSLPKVTSFGTPKTSNEGHMWHSEWYISG